MQHLWRSQDQVEDKSNKRMNCTVPALQCFPDTLLSLFLCPQQIWLHKSKPNGKALTWPPTSAFFRNAILLWEPLVHATKAWVRRCGAFRLRANNGMPLQCEVGQSSMATESSSMLQNPAAAEKTWLSLQAYQYIENRASIWQACVWIKLMRWSILLTSHTRQRTPRVHFMVKECLQAERKQACIDSMGVLLLWSLLCVGGASETGAAESKNNLITWSDRCVKEARQY